MQSNHERSPSVPGSGLAPDAYFGMKPICVKRLLLASAVISLTGCGPLATTRPDGVVERHYFGYVKVLVPDPRSTPGRIAASDVTSFGIRWHNGLGIGYFSGKEVVTPLDCRIVFLVKDREQIDRTIKLFNNNVKESEVCAAIF